MNRIVRLLSLISLLLLLFTAASAESVRLVTPGGSANVRKTASEKGHLAGTIPNGSMVELTGETEGDWYRVTYKKVNGYVHKSLLRTVDRLPGLRVYSDGEQLPLYRTAEEDADIIAVAYAREAVTVINAQDGWALIRRDDGTEGYTPTSLLSWQYETDPGAKLTELSETGVVLSAQTLRREPGVEAAACGKVAMDTEILVLDTRDGWCLVQAEVCGWVPVNTVQLTLAAQGEADEKLIKTAKQLCTSKYKQFAKEKLYAVVSVTDTRDGVPGPFTQVGFFSDEGQYRYTVLLDAKGKTVYRADYTAFGLYVRNEGRMPVGEMALRLSADSLKLGEVLDISVETWSGAAIRYTVSLNGKKVAEAETAEHLTASFRPREAGIYTVKATVQDKVGNVTSDTAEFSVKAAEPGLESVYSQKDGWWKKKTYGTSQLEQSGCAIFALSHALQRLGYTGDDIRPENLAKKYAKCLIQGGTNNGKLIRLASEAYNFTTKAALVTDKKVLAEKLRAGALFSFSVARGHIALMSGISEDGTMVLITDSAPQATFERIKNASLYYIGPSGDFIEAESLEDIPGARWYIDTAMYGGLEYYLPIAYCANRGGRLIEKN